MGKGTATRDFVNDLRGYIDVDFKGLIVSKGHRMAETASGSTNGLRAADAAIEDRSGVVMGKAMATKANGFHDGATHELRHNVNGTDL